MARAFLIILLYALLSSVMLSNQVLMRLDETRSEGK